VVAEALPALLVQRAQMRGVWLHQCIIQTEMFSIEVRFALTFLVVADVFTLQLVREAYWPVEAVAVFGGSVVLVESAGLEHIKAHLYVRWESNVHYRLAHCRRRTAL